MSMFAAIVLGEELEKMTRRAEAAEAALAERDNPCVWTYKRYGGWFTTCQVRPASHSVSWKFCPYCGHPIEVTP